MCACVFAKRDSLRKFWLLLLHVYSLKSFKSPDEMIRDAARTSTDVV